MDTVTLTLPEAWATFLLYGDAEGISLDEEQAAILTLDAQGITNRTPIDIIPAGFRWKHDATGFGFGGAECVDVIYSIDLSIFDNP